MERREKASRAIFIIFLLSFLWSISIIFSPVFLPENSVEDLSGQTAVVDNNFLTKTLPFPMNGVYAIGDRLCHQLDERSFFANGNQMPFCSRCTAIFVGLSMGLLFISFFKVPLDELFIFVIILSLVPIGIDGVGQLLGFWESTNIIRVITGIIIGVPSGIAIGLIIDEATNWLKTKNVNKRIHLPFQR